MTDEDKNFIAKIALALIALLSAWGLWYLLGKL